MAGSCLTDPGKRQHKSSRPNTCDMHGELLGIRSSEGNDHVPVSHTLKSSPTLWLHGKRLTNRQPMIFGMKYIIPTQARLLGIREAILTPVKIVRISTTPPTHPNNVVCRFENPNSVIMMAVWLVKEFGTLSSAAKSAKSHVFGSMKASYILGLVKHTINLVS